MTKSISRSFTIVLIAILALAWDQYQANDSIEYYQSRVADSPNNSTGHYNLGVAYVKGGRVEQGIAEFEKAVELDPTNKETLIALGQIYEGEGPDRYKNKAVLEKSRIYYEQALRLDSGDRHVRRLLAFVYWHQDKPTNAIYHLGLTGWESWYGPLVQFLILVACVMAIAVRGKPRHQVKIFGFIFIISVLNLVIPPLRPIVWSTGLPVVVAIFLSATILLQSRRSGD